jgi:hypothetical protein
MHADQEEHQGQGQEMEGGVKKGFIQNKRLKNVHGLKYGQAQVKPGQTEGQGVGCPQSQNAAIKEEQSQTNESEITFQPAGDEQEEADQGQVGAQLDPKKNNAIEK